MPVPQDFRRGQEMLTSAGGQWSAGNEESILMNRKGAAKAGPVPTSTSTHLPARWRHIISLWAQPTGSPQGCNWASFKLVIFKNSISDSYWAILNIPTTEFFFPPNLETNLHPTGLLAPTIDLCLVQQTGVHAQGNSCILKTWTIEICKGSNYLFLCGTVSLGPQTRSGTDREPNKCLEENESNSCCLCG